MHWACQAQGQPAARMNRRFTLSPIDALIDLVVRCGLRCQIPVRFDFDTLTHLRITALPQRWPACGGYARGLGVNTNVLQNLPDLCALGDERDQPHLPAAHRARQRKNLVNAGDQHLPQVVRR